MPDVATAEAPEVSKDELQRTYSALSDELARRRRLKSEKFLKWVVDPVGFVFNVLLGFLWSKQRTIMESVRDHRRTAVPSCHDVGKTYVAASIAAWWIASHKPGEAFVVTVAPTHHQVKALLWRELNRMHAAGGLPGEMNMTEWWLGNELVAFGRSPADTDPTAIQGIHAKYVLVIFDEAGGVARAIKDGADSLIANDTSRFLGIGNPDDPTTWFAEVCKPGSGYNVISLDALESPNFTGEEVPDWLRPLLIGKTWVEEKKKDWGEESPLYQSKVRGKFPEQASDALVPTAALEAAKRRGIECNGEMGDGVPNELGLDVARFGGDKIVLWHRRGNNARKYWEDSKRDLMTTVGHVRLALAETGARRIKIDDIGMGGGVTDRLNELQSLGEIPAHVEIIGVDVGDSPDDLQADEHFKNKRAELNWQLRMRFVEGRIALIGECDTLIAQAGQIKYQIKSDRLLIEPKADMKKRTKGVSPDDWDALVLCFGDASTGAAAWIEHFANMAARANDPNAPKKPSTDNRPWQTPGQKPAAPVTNDLAKFYEDELAKGMAVQAQPCARCKKPVEGNSRVTDGVQVWHPECV